MIFLYIYIYKNVHTVKLPCSCHKKVVHTYGFISSLPMYTNRNLGETHYRVQRYIAKIYHHMGRRSLQWRSEKDNISMDEQRVQYTVYIWNITVFNLVHLLSTLATCISTLATTIPTIQLCIACKGKYAQQFIFFATRGQFNRSRRRISDSRGFSSLQMNAQVMQASEVMTVTSGGDINYFSPID